MDRALARRLEARFEGLLHGPAKQRHDETEVRIGPEFFKTLGVPLLLGRDFGSQDTEKSSRVAVINETMARSFFGNGSIEKIQTW